MSRIGWILAGAVLVSASASAALACTPVYRIVPPIEGESHEDMLARSRALEQSEFRAQADTIYLAEVSQTRFVGDRETEATFTPLYVFEGDEMPSSALTLRRSACFIPVFSQRYVVYASRATGEWSIVAFLAPDMVVDPGIRLHLRDAMRDVRSMERGLLPAPVYPD